MANNRIIEAITVLGHVDWDSVPALGNIDYEIHDAHSIIQLPGPTRYPVRPHLEPVSGGGGIAARVVDALKTTAPMVFVVRDGMKAVSLTRPPLAVSVRNDGKLWVLTKGALSLVDDDGHPLQEREINGYFLLAANEDAVWVVEGSRDIAYRVDRQGEVVGTFDWKNGLNSRSSAAGSLCRIEKGELRQLTEDGRESTVSIAGAVDAYEALLWLGDSGFITASGSTFRRYDSAGHRTKSVTIQSAGLTANGQPFASGRDGRYVNLWNASGEMERYLLDDSIPEMGAFTAVAVEHQGVLIYGQDRAAWYRGSHPAESFEVTNSTYLEKVFPLQWSLAPSYVTAASGNGRLLLSASSARGMTLFAVDW